jgi:hypothetical protein
MILDLKAIGFQIVVFGILIFIFAILDASQQFSLAAASFGGLDLLGRALTSQQSSTNKATCSKCGGLCSTALNLDNLDFLFSLNTVVSNELCWKLHQMSYTSS